MKSIVKIRPVSLITLLLIIIPLVSGCGSRDSNNPGAAALLKNDAAAALKGTLAEDYSRLTIIRGALYKLTVNPRNPQLIGTALGAAEAVVFPDEYELNRFSKLENLSAEMRREIISQPMLNIILKKRDALNHVYTAVLKPLAENMQTGRPATPQEIAVVNNLVGMLDTVARNYALLSGPAVDLNSGEAQQAFLSLQSTFREMQKLQLVRQPDRPNSQ